ncbi:MAG: hypothetical protein GY880_00295 [Planctomycetaceae bacterium]|nr:hypothetical protein [Planctomycetaceae bacterium]MCP4772654.1 hypothetical protein [Planctomycetaceae bacterium]
MRLHQMICTFANHSWRVSLLFFLFVMGMATVSEVMRAQEALSETASEQTEVVEVEPEISEADLFVPDFDDQDLVETRERAWEYRPYQVAVWFCLDGSPLLDAIYNNIAKDVTRRSELLDPSGWDLTTGRAPVRWRNRFIDGLGNPEEFEALESVPALLPYDKLMVVCLEEAHGTVDVRVREFDIQTQLWGPLVVREVIQRNELGRYIMDAISVAFMPLAKIDRVQEIEVKNSDGKIVKKDEVIMQIRGVKSCIRTTLQPKTRNQDDEAVAEIDDAAFEWKAAPIVGSPIYIRDDDRFLPIIRLTDRKGELVKLQPIEFTYLTSERKDGADLRASIESNRRAPLSQRKSKRSQKLALVIRPPERSTRLFLVSDDKDRTPMEGFEVWARSPEAPVEDKILLGKTDWRGSIDIPPDSEGLRLILIKRGERGLRRLPIMPGLYDSVESTLPNDETRLYAQGVVRGLENEILSMVIQRTVFEADAKKGIEDKNMEFIKKSLNQLEDLSISEMLEELTDQELKLKARTSNGSELAYITRRFGSLRTILNERLQASDENLLSNEYEEMRKIKLNQ